MILVADELPIGVKPQADLCIVGAGPAGIVLALRAAEQGAHVLLLESGGRRPDADGQALCIGEVANTDLHPPADAFRRRSLGGSSTIWGGRCVPLDPIDFAARTWLDLPSGWTISYETLLPFLRLAHRWAELGRFDYAAMTAIRGGMRPMFEGFASATISTERIERFSGPTDFGTVYGDRLARERRVQVLLHATCTNIELDSDAKAVTHLDLVTRGGRALQVQARAFVLATGGLEVPRLLLASRSRVAAGIGNSHGLVGRYYMCHLAGTLGRFTAAAGRRVWHGYERAEGGIYCRRRISVQPWAQQAYRIGNVIARLHHPSPADPAHRCAALSAVFLGRRLLPYEYVRRVEGAADQSTIWPHLRNIATDPLGMARFVAHSLRYRYFAARKYPSIVVAARNGVFMLDVHAEQLPNADSRITLADDPDRFGVPKLRIDWKYRPEDVRSVVVTLELLKDAIAKGHHGSFEFDPTEVEAGLVREGAYGGHHLGTARMSDSPRTGVVNADCQVHGVANLYVAGGAVFATSGQANPTLTVLALALRLADHLARHVVDRAAPTMRVRTVTTMPA